MHWGMFHYNNDVPQCTHDIPIIHWTPQCTDDIPHKSWYQPMHWWYPPQKSSLNTHTNDDIIAMHWSYTHNALHSPKCTGNTLYRVKPTEVLQMFDLLLLMNLNVYEYQILGGQEKWACLLMHQSIPSANIPRQTPGEFFWGSQKPCPGQNFPAKARPLGQKKPPTPGEYFRRSSQPFLLIDIEIPGFCRNQTLKRIGRLSNYSLVILFSFSLSTILKVFKFSPSFETDFVTREHQQMVDRFVAEKCLHAASTDNLVLW